jgi:hypothetical protein
MEKKPIKPDNEKARNMKKIIVTVTLSLFG